MLDYPAVSRSEHTQCPIRPITLPAARKMTGFVDHEQFKKEECFVTTAQISVFHQCTENIPPNTVDKNDVQTVFGLIGNDLAFDQWIQNGLFVCSNKVIPLLIPDPIIQVKPERQLILGFKFDILPG